MNIAFFENLVDQKLLGMHTCYLATVISVSESKAKIQPLALIKARGEPAKKQTVIEDVPILQHVQDVSSGSVVLVVCCERDISQPRKGLFALPSLRHHSLSDSVIIGLMPEVST